MSDVQEEQEIVFNRGDSVSATFICGRGITHECLGTFQYWICLGLPPKKYAVIKLNGDGYVMVKHDQMERE